jgi:DNA-3-methyladenine glycosylase
MDPAFYDRHPLEVAPEMVGCIVRHGETAGRIVETEAYHESEPACHAFKGLKPSTEVLFGPTGHWYVYRSYGIHAMLNAVTGPPGEGAAVLIRALEPLAGVDTMRERRGLERLEDLCSGPGKLTQALGIWLDLDGSRFGDPIEILPREHEPAIVAGPRIGINVAIDLPWRFCDPESRSVSRPWPLAMRQR